MIICTKCGAQLADGVKFCNACGTPVAAKPAGGSTAKPGDTAKPGGAAGTMCGTTLGVVLGENIPIVLNGKVCIIESRIKTSGEAVVYTIKMDGKMYIFKHYKPSDLLSDTVTLSLLSLLLFL